MGLPVPGTRELFDGVTSAHEAAERKNLNAPGRPMRELTDDREGFINAMTKATASGLMGETVFGGVFDTSRPRDFPIPEVRREPSRSADVRKALDAVDLAKSSIDPGMNYTGARSEYFSKEWTLTNPLSTGLVPYDLFGIAA